MARRLAPLAISAVAALTCLFGPMLVVADASSASAEARAPAAIRGIWRSDCTFDLPHRLRVRADTIMTWTGSGQASCRLTSQRALGPQRWYLDFKCADESLLDLDINLLARGRLLVARRPLGQACFYRR